MPSRRGRRESQSDSATHPFLQSKSKKKKKKATKSDKSGTQIKTLEPFSEVSSSATPEPQVVPIQAPVAQAPAPAAAPAAAAAVPEAAVCGTDFLFRAISHLML